MELGMAYYEATQKSNLYQEELKKLYDTFQGEDAVQVVLTGRAYNILSESMNKNIPEMFSNLGVKTFYQDMIEPAVEDTDPVKPLLNAFHWDQASRILETAAICTRVKNLYPVFITSFKCSPDSFAIEYFKRILDQQEKPYLILQLDDHDSNVGYETRVEAAVRAFRNHYQSLEQPETLPKVKRKALAVNPILTDDLKGKTIFFPTWDHLTLPLVAAYLNQHGYDVRFLEEDPQSIQKSMRHNTGQCIPLNAIAQGFIDYIYRYNLNPADTVLWFFFSLISCNVRLYPHYIKTILESHGLSEAGVYVGNLTLMDMVPLGGIDTYFAYFFGGLLRSLGCRTRPYELEPGATDRAILAGRDVLVQVFSSGKDREEALEEVYQLFAAVPVDRSKRKPLVAIFGDFYVRDNEIMNQNLIKAIEDAGGEVIATSFVELMRIASKPNLKRMRMTGRYKEYLMLSALLSVVELMEKKYYGVLQKMQQGIVASDPNYEDFQAKFNIRVEQEGESSDNILKIFHIMKEHPDVALFVQANPAFCCPALISEAMRGEIERVTGVPVVSITYDGTGTYKNSLIAPYLRYAKKRGEDAAPERSILSPNSLSARL
jgi:predicted nucleotide-binding protein (sugar kinase/HSP70/actin superfamily)